MAGVPEGYRDCEKEAGGLGARKRPPERHRGWRKDAEATEDSREGSCDKESVDRPKNGPRPRSSTIHRRRSDA